MKDRDTTPLVLSPAQHQAILATLILPTLITNMARQDHPLVVYVSGQPGSGKTALADMIHTALRHRGGAVRIGSDAYKTFHPAYRLLLAEDDRTAGLKVRPDTRRWRDDVEQHVRQRRLDAVVEAALEDPQGFRGAAGAYRAAGYRIEVAVLATPEALSQLGITHRYASEVHTTGGGRYVSPDNHDTCSTALIDTLAVIEAEYLADRVTVFRRGHESLYTNTLANGSWHHPPNAARAVIQERSRPWSAAETHHFRNEVSLTEQQAQPGLMPDERRHAVTGGIQRASALAHPLRRLEQLPSPRTAPDYHRLSRKEHTRIWEERIVPLLLNSVTAQAHPVVTYVMAQPGAGKTFAADLVQRATITRSPIRLAGDRFKMFHPDYLQLLTEDPRTAGARIRQDYRAWHANAESLLRSHRADMLIECAPGSAQEFWSSAQAAQEADYRIEIVLLAVREADSRQGAAHRYAQAQRHGVPGRFTSASGHDRCYHAITEIVQAMETHPAVNSVIIMRRDLESLRHTVRMANSSWAQGSARFAAVLTAERNRPYTQAEARRFIRIQQVLRTALPQYRVEVEQIAKLASPLLPDQFQPRQLVYAPAPLALLSLPAPRGAVH
ncbi:zeta toxin family protein [Streptomyces sp. cg36]|uniref:zeta toxin family protein n=1 Tax=Streptomyces sp. cg36 TaxID=3238798 RepID=UPI0034E2BCB6